MDLIREPGRDIARGEAVEAGLDAMIVRRNDWPVAEEGTPKPPWKPRSSASILLLGLEGRGLAAPLVRVDYEGCIPLIRRCRISDWISWATLQRASENPLRAKFDCPKSYPRMSLPSI